MQSYGRLISILYRKAQVYLDSALRPYGLTASEQPFLTTLYQHDGMSQEQLSEHLMIDKAATARTIASLADKGFVEKRKVSGDKRINRIFLTQQGRESESFLIPILHRWSELLVVGMREETREMVYRGLESMVTQVESREAGQK